MKSEADVIKREVVAKAENYFAKFDCRHLSIHNFFVVQRVCRPPGVRSEGLKKTVLREISGMVRNTSQLVRRFR